MALDQKVEERSKDIRKIHTEMDPLCMWGCLRQVTSTQPSFKSRLYPFQVRITPVHSYPPRHTYCDLQTPSWAILGFGLQADSHCTHTGFLSFPTALKLCSVELRKFPAGPCALRTRA